MMSEIESLPLFQKFFGQEFLSLLFFITILCSEGRKQQGWEYYFKEILDNGDDSSQNFTSYLLNQ